MKELSLSGLSSFMLSCVRWPDMAVITNSPLWMERKNLQVRLVYKNR